MKILIAEDDFVSRRLINEQLAGLGECCVVEDGLEAVNAVREALDEDSHFDLVCLDIKMPNKDGHDALKEIRELEAGHKIRLGDGCKVIMTTIFSDSKNVLKAFNNQCEAYIVKPITREKIERELSKLGLHKASGPAS